MKYLKSGFWFVYLSLICVIVFVLQNIFNGFTDMFTLNLKAIYEYQIWRFVTSIFLHGGVVHLLYNLFALLFFGFILERKIGSWKFVGIFFISGIIGNIIGVNFYSSSLGASGAIYGILGCLAIINPFMMVFAFGIIMPMFIAAIVWIIGDVMGVFGFGSQGTGYIAHLGGVFVGVVVGIVLRLFIRNGTRDNGNSRKIVIDEGSIRGWEDSWMR
ncbi:rhomboid family intramembrane serine protease [Candidatus Pacearchaeota archaeon]|nr:rhomboid family intramembrane serine protease [Candidatus Pacearchaeota archaeon]